MSRRGQKTFRKRLVESVGRCEATLSKLLFAIDACHIKPYSECDESEKNDPNNSILLLASIHRAFDHGYISFNDDGRLIVSEELSDWECKSLGLSGTERIQMPGKRTEYMRFHRENIFKS